MPQPDPAHHPGPRAVEHHSPAGWAAPAGAAPAGQPAPGPQLERPAGTGPLRGRLGPGLLVALLVLAVAGASGLFGGWVALQFHTDEPARAAGAATLDRSSLSAVVAQVQPSVVSIQAGGGEGSGVILDEQGHVLTNAHVVANAGGEPVSVTFSDGDAHEATVVGADDRSDLAVLKVEGADQLTPVSFGDSDTAQIGDAVLALGSPLGLEGSVTSGIVSAKNRTIQVGQPQPSQPGQAAAISGMIQTDAPINPGNSGGALANLAGEVIGINSAIATTGANAGSIGVGFAIPSNTAQPVAEQLIAGEQVSHPWAGVSVADASGDGALVQAVAPDSPAEQAGLRPGDVITSVADQPVRSSDELVAAVQRSQVGDALAVGLTRDGGPQQLTLTVGEAPVA